MSPLDWFKKEKPLLGLLGMGGGGSGEAAAFEITGGTNASGVKVGSDEYS